MAVAAAVGEAARRASGGGRSGLRNRRGLARVSCGVAPLAGRRSDAPVAAVPGLAGSGLGPSTTAFSAPLKSGGADIRASAGKWAGSASGSKRAGSDGVQPASRSWRASAAGGARTPSGAVVISGFHAAATASGGSVGAGTLPLARGVSGEKRWSSSL